jgi:hypothetical protein
MVGARGPDRVFAVAVVAVAIACAGCASAVDAAPSVEAALAAAGAPAASIPCGAPAARSSVAASVPPGWTSVSSPWLGYSVAVPASWGLRGHVGPGDSRAPYDVFEGTIPGSAVQALVVVGCNPLKHARAAGTFLGDVTADGTTLDLFESPADEPGRVILFAKGIRGDAEWHLMALVPSDVGASAFFREVVATFRFPAPTPSAQAGG